MGGNICDYCAYYVYDEEYEEYQCQVTMDEDDLYRSAMTKNKECPYFRSGDEYLIARKQ